MKENIVNLASSKEGLNSYISIKKILTTQQ